jgi:uncharacterized protein
MSRSSQRALRFGIAAFEGSAGGQGGLRVSLTGGLDTIDAPGSIRQAIRLLLSTEPGERVMRPTYGCPLSQLMFAPNDDTTAGLAIHFVRRALEAWEPRIEITRLEAKRHDDQPARLDLMLEYRIRQTGVVDGVTVPLSLSGESAP